MKVIFDKADLNEKLADILRTEGLEVIGDPLWSDENIHVQMQITPIKQMAAPTKEDSSPSRAQLEEMVKDLSLTVRVLQERSSASTEKRAQERFSGEEETPAKNTEEEKKRAKSYKNMTPRMRQIQEEIDREQDLIGDPRGAGLKKGERRLSKNESDVFPD